MSLALESDPTMFDCPAKIKTRRVFIFSVFWSWELANEASNMEATDMRVYFIVQHSKFNFRSCQSLGVIILTGPKSPDGISGGVLV